MIEDGIVSVFDNLAPKESKSSLKFDVNDVSVRSDLVDLEDAEASEIKKVKWTPALKEDKQLEVSNQEEPAFLKQ